METEYDAPSPSMVLKFLLAFLVLSLLVWIGFSFVHEYSGHPIKKSTEHCIRTPLGKICAGEVDYFPENK